MNYDLYFCTQSADKLTFPQISNFFKTMRNFEIMRETDAGIEIRYKNPRTGVYFTLYFIPEDSRRYLENDLPAGYFPVGLTFHMGFEKPYFFGKESMLIVASIAKAFNLFVVDPQDSVIDGTGRPKPCVLEELVQTWEQLNTEASVARINQDRPFKFMPRQRSIVWWEYTQMQDSLQRELGKNTLVPPLSIIQRNGTVELFTVLFWPDCQSIVLPECDMLMLGKPKSGVHAEANPANPADYDIRVVTYAHLQSKVYAQFSPLAASLPNLRLLKPEKTAECREAFNAMFDYGVSLAEFQSEVETIEDMDFLDILTEFDIQFPRY